MTYKYHKDSAPRIAKVISVLEKHSPKFRTAVTDFGKFQTLLVKSKPSKGKDGNEFLGTAFELFAEFFINHLGTRTVIGLENFIPISRTKYDDHGVDGVANLIDSDEKVTVQVKFKSNPTQDIDRNNDHIGNFFEQSSIDFGVTDHKRMVLFTNAFGFSHNLKAYSKRVDNALITNLTKKYGKKFFTELFDAWNDVVNSITATTRANIVPHVLYNHQVLTKSILDSFTEGQGIVTYPTGGGKTISIIEDVNERMRKPGKKVFLMSYPRLALADQTQKKMFRSVSTEYKQFFICSKKDFEQDILFADESLAENNSSTKSEIIANFIQTHMLGNVDNLLIHSTYQSLHKFKNAISILEQRGVEVVFDTWYADEAHNLVIGVDPDKTKSIEKKVSLDERLDSHRTIVETFTRSTFWTATVKINDTGYSMDNTDLFGSIVSSVPAQLLIDQGIIVAPKVFVIRPDAGYIITSSGMDDESNIDYTYYVCAIERELILRKKTNSNTRIMIFCRSAKITRPMETALKAYFPSASVGSVRSDTTTGQREDIFESFGNSDFSILLNYDIVSEGIDIDGTTAVIIGRGMNDIKIVQATGRALRVYSGDRKNLSAGVISTSSDEGWIKRYGHVYFPMDGNDIESQIKFDKQHDLIEQLVSAGFNNSYSSAILLESKPRGPQGEDGKSTFDTLFNEEDHTKELSLDEELKSKIQIREAVTASRRATFDDLFELA